MPDQNNATDPAQGAVGSAQSAHADGSGSSEGVANQAGSDGGNTDADKLLKRIEDLQRQNRALQSDKDSALSQKTKIEEQFLSRLTDAATANKQPDNSAAERQAYLDQLAADLDDNMDGKKIVSLLDKMAADARSGALSEADKKIQALQETLNGLQKNMGEFDPKWQSEKSRIEELGLREKFPNASRQDLLQIVSLIPGETAQPAQPDIPGGMGGGIHAGSEGSKVSSDTWAAIKATLPAGITLTDDQKVALEKKWSQK